MMRHGIRPDGTASMPLLMPFWNMADEDLVAVVSYLRSLPPVDHKVDDAHYTFMGKAVRTFAPTFKPIENPLHPKQHRRWPLLLNGENISRAMSAIA
jgi:hypothetical protein